MSGRRPLGGSFYGFQPAPPTVAEAMEQDRRAAERRANEEEFRLSCYDVTRGEFEEIVNRVTELEAKLAKL